MLLMRPIDRAPGVARYFAKEVVSLDLVAQHENRSGLRVVHAESINNTQLGDWLAGCFFL